MGLTISRQVYILEKKDAMQQNKYEVGDKVKELDLPDSEGGAVTKILYDSDKGFTYVFATKELDHKKKEIIEGFKTCGEAELEVFNESE